LCDQKVKERNTEIKNLETLKRSGKDTGNKAIIDLPNEPKIEVDEFISRHGAISPLSENGLQWINNSNEVKELKSKNILDQSIRNKLWDDNDFLNHKDIFTKLMQARESIVIGIIKHHSKNLFLFTKRKFIKDGIEWGFITKKLQPGFDAQKALSLECFNETGIECEVKHLIGGRTHPRSGVYAEYWYCIQTGDNEPYVRDSNELVEVHWFTANEIFEVAIDIYEPIRAYLCQE